MKLSLSITVPAIVACLCAGDAFAGPGCTRLSLDLLEYSINARGRQVGTLNVERTYQELEKLRAEADATTTVREMANIEGRPLWRFDFPATEAAPDGKPPLRVVITAGVHGNEPLGVTTAMQVIAALEKIPDLRRRFAVTVIPIMNPGGIERAERRVNPDLDLNRNFFLDKWPGPWEGIRKSLAEEKFDLAIDLHGANLRTGFFLIRGNEDATVAQQVVSRIKQDRLLQTDNNVYPGFVGISIDPQRYSLDAAGSAMSNNKGTLKSFWTALGVPNSFTLEFPGQLDRTVQAMDLYRMTLAAMYATRNAAGTP